MSEMGILTAAPKSHRIKQVVLILMLSVVASLIMPVLDNIILVILTLHHKLVEILGLVFANDLIGNTILSVISMTLLPFLSGGLIAGLYWLVKRDTLPYLMEFIWVTWLLLVVTVALRGQ